MEAVTGTDAATTVETGRYTDGLRALDRDLVTARCEALAPPPKLTLSEWAERYFRLSPESSAETGRFRPWGFQVGMLDAVTDPANERVTVIKSARVGYTKLIDAAVGYFIHQDPAPVLVVNPRVEDAEEYSKTEIAPMLRDCPALAGIVGEVKGKDPNHTIRKKVFRNGASLSLLGANSPNEFRRVTARVVAFDEVDAYPEDKDEGDQISLGERRTTSFWNRKILQGSTPTVKGESRIETAWEESDQRRYYVPCPHCHEEQTLEFGARTPHGLKWPEGEPEAAYYVCINGCVIDESHKPWMIANGRWISGKPAAGHAGFHISALYSLFYNARWGAIAREFVDVKDDPPRLQVFVNTVLGETWEPPADQEVEESNLMARREVYPAEVPDGVAVLTMAIDTQDDRLECEVVGWGWDEESWSIGHFVFLGDPDEQHVWEQADAVRLKRWHCADGRQLAVDSTCVDTGGHHTEAAYKYCVARIQQKVWPIKGQSRRDGQRSQVFPRKPKRRPSKGGVQPYMVDVNAAKDVIFPRLAKAEPGPGYSHFPAHYEADYFYQVTAERPVSERVNGRRVRRWKQKPGRRNEAFDLRVYNYAALCALQNAGLKLNEWAAKVGATRPQDRGPIEFATSATRSVQQAPTMPESPPAGAGTTIKRKPRRRRRRARMAMG